MTTRPKGKIGQQLRTVFNLGTIGDLTDGQLLERFATRGGEAAELAFAALVERHGPMVLRVCRHALVELHDAEDAFQATFLILVKQARSLWVQDSLGPWLHRVAHRVATRARAAAARVREHERRAAATRPDRLRETRDWDEVVEHLHEEIDRLPERYRVPVVLCDLEGLTHEKAARHLGWPVGTLKTRLARARELLRSRLCRGGRGLPEKLLGADKRLAMVLPLGAQARAPGRAGRINHSGRGTGRGGTATFRFRDLVGCRHFDRGGTEDHGRNQIEAGRGGGARGRLGGRGRRACWRSRELGQERSRGE